MKKFTSFLFLLILLISNISFVFSSSSVVVSAVVWNLNQAPVVLSVNPNYSPLQVEYGGIQNISLQVKDVEWDITHYSISTPNWAVSIINGSLTNSTNLKNGIAYISFTYIAPASWIDTSFDITVTLNDGPNFVTKTIPVFVYNF